MIENGQFVYAIGAKPSGPFKIGRTESHKSLSQRLKSFSSGHPEKLGVWAVWSFTTPEDEPIDNSQGERILHEHFVANRLNGEWFDITAEQLYRMEREKFAEAIGRIRQRSKDSPATRRKLRVPEEWTDVYCEFRADFDLCDEAQAFVERLDA